MSKSRGRDLQLGDQVFLAWWWNEADDELLVIMNEPSPSYLPRTIETATLFTRRGANISRRTSEGDLPANDSGGPAHPYITTVF